MAAITSDSCPLPLASSTRRFTIFAFGATPLNVCVKFVSGGLRSIRGYDSRHVRAMSILIRRIQAGHKALAEYDARMRTVARGQVALQRHTAVDHRNTDACSIPALAPQSVRVHRLGGNVQETGYGPVRRDVGNLRVRCQALQHRNGHRHVSCREAAEVPVNTA